jgi:hypothetical protein
LGQGPKWAFVVVMQINAYMAENQGQFFEQSSASVSVGYHDVMLETSFLISSTVLN